MLIDFNKKDWNIFEGMNGGKGKAICNGEEEILTPGVCHYCPKDSAHTIINTGDEDLTLYTVVQYEQ